VLSLFLRDLLMNSGHTNITVLLIEIIQKRVAREMRKYLTRREYESFKEKSSFLRKESISLF